MQTFLPYEDFEQTAAVLDARRLGKQRVEALQVVNAMHDPNYGWRNHPVVKMWRGHEPALVAYGIAITREWIRRGYNDTVLDQLLAHLHGARERTQQELAAGGLLPPWLGDPEIHRRYRSALVRKDPGFYRERFPDVPDDLGYLWPVT